MYSDAMPQSLAKIYIHLIFPTENRERILAEESWADLHAYMGGTLKGMDCIPLEINSESEHAHVLLLLGRKIAPSEVIGGLKKSAKDWLRTKGERYRTFLWQAGQGAYPVSQSGVDEVRKFPRSQLLCLPADCLSAACFGPTRG
jgi:REP element-mobilizing transposase RayT